MLNCLALLICPLFLPRRTLIFSLVLLETTKGSRWLSVHTKLTSRPALVFAPPFRPFAAYNDISGAAILTPLATVFGSVAVLTKRHGSRLSSISWETHGSKNLEQLLDAKHENHIPGITILINFQLCLILILLSYTWHHDFDQFSVLLAFDSCFIYPPDN